MKSIMQLTHKIDIFYILLSCLTFVRSEFDETVNEVHSPVYYRRDAKAGQFPWVVSFKTVEHCMGTLIRPSWVLSAAHCLEPSSDPAYYTLELGYARGTQSQVETASELHPCPRYRSSEVSRVRDHAHDIALLKMKNPFKPAPTLPLRSVPYVSDKYRKRPCHILGFVKELSNPGEDYKTLQFGRVFGLTYEDCYKRARFQEKRAMRHTLCTVGTDRNAKEACSGSPGGPLVCPAEVATRKKSKQVELVGVSSWNKPGIYCGAMSQYTDVGYFIKWLNATIEGKPHDDTSNAIRANKLREDEASIKFSNSAVGPKYTIIFHVMTSLQFLFKCFQRVLELYVS